jgi:TIR domain
VSVGMKGSIFISYRRKEAVAFAGRLAAELRRDGYEVFIDVGIHAGEKWREKIEQALSSCAVLLAVMGRDWLEMKDDHGRRRLDDSDDVVRFEIEAALQRDVPVIPVLIDDAEPPKRSELPTSLRAAVDREGETVRNPKFEVDYKGVKKTIDGYIKSPPYARSLSAIAGLLLVLAGASFATLERPLTRLVPTGPGFFGTQIADFVTAVGLVVLGAGLLFTRSWWKNAGWLATAGLFIGLLPFLSLRIWRSAKARGQLDELLAWLGPLVLIFLALVLIAILLARNPEVAFARPRVSGDSTLTAIVLGLVALIGLAAIGVLLPTPGADRGTHKFSDPNLLYFAVPLAIIATFTQGLPKAAVLAGWTGGSAGVLVTTVWLRLHPGRIPASF